MDYQQVRLISHNLFMKEHQISHTHKFVGALFPVYNKKKYWRKSTPHSISIEIIYCWFNLKARLMEFGTRALFPRFFELSVDEFIKYIYLFYSIGLKLSPGILKKFKNNWEHPLQGEYFHVIVFVPYDENHLK